MRGGLFVWLICLPTDEMYLGMVQKWSLNPCRDHPYPTPFSFDPFLKNLAPHFLATALSQTVELHYNYVLRCCYDDDDDNASGGDNDGGGDDDDEDLSVLTTLYILCRGTLCIDPIL